MSQLNQHDVLVIGAGAAGMMAAGISAQNGKKVCLIEKNARVGRKIMITGKGRCNLTNNCNIPEFIASVPTNGRFLYSAVSGFTPQDTMSFFENLGVPLKTERGNRVFPQSDKACDIVDALSNFVKKSRTEVITGQAERLLIEEGILCGVVLHGGRKIFARQVVLACGGVSYPATGSTGDGYKLAEQAGHSIVPLRPSLVPLTASGDDCRNIMGLSLKNIAISVMDTKKKKEIFHDFGEMLFTHFGVSGPVILSASTHMRDMASGRYVLSIDLKPALTPEQLDSRLQRDFEVNNNRDFSNSLGALLPHKLIPVAVRRSGIPADAKCNQITKGQRREFAELLKNFLVNITGFRPIEEAIVTSGGINVKEINPKTMESKILPGLFFAGEVMDVDGYTGGFNLQIAFCTGYLAAQAVSEQKQEELK